LWDCGLRNCKKYANEYFNDGNEVYKKQSNPEIGKLEENVKDIMRDFFFGNPTYYQFKTL